MFKRWNPPAIFGWIGFRDHACRLQWQLLFVHTVPVTSIGDHVLFAGARSLCVSSSWLPSIGGNSVVFFHAGEDYLAQYHLSCGTWSLASDGHLKLSPPQRPCGLIHHIFTCCELWSAILVSIFVSFDILSLFSFRHSILPPVHSMLIERKHKWDVCGLRTHLFLYSEIQEILVIFQLYKSESKGGRKEFFCKALGYCSYFLSH
jgi:hypothetical protein